MIPRTVTASAAALVLLVAACGDDDEGGGSAAEFCALITEDSPVFSAEASPEESTAALRGFVDAAPGEIRDDLQQLLDANIELAETDFDELSVEEFEELNERFAGLEDAQRNAEAWVLENCDAVPDDFFE